jgi:hypothetical protein
MRLATGGVNSTATLCAQFAPIRIGIESSLQRARPSRVPSMRFQATYRPTEGWRETTCDLSTEGMLAAQWIGPHTKAVLRLLDVGRRYNSRHTRYESAKYRLALHVVD